ncbi:tetraspanin-1 [Odontesthes bonariensis]|uniref:tetraspanin-1 n=1 Tax=Odontesthes bonariensis TaxID=219752 RepID=UPI003F58B593
MGCFTFVKLMMVLLDLLIFLSGLTVLATGIWLSVDSSFFLQFLGLFSNQIVRFGNVIYLCVAIGGVLVVLGLVGFCGAQKESKWLLLTFFSIVLIIFITEVAAGVVLLANSSFAEEILRLWATPELQNNYGSDPVVTQFWNTTMTELRCCGFSSYVDFVGSKFEEQNGGSLPPACCWTGVAPCSPAEAERRPVEGCFQQILEIVKGQTDVIGGIAAGIGALEIAAMTVSMYLYCHLKNAGS